MIKILNKKWWTILIQGSLLIALSIIIFNNPGTILMAISFWLGIIVLTVGMLGVLSYFISSKNEREKSLLIWSSVIVIVGILMMIKVVVTMKIITVLFGLIVSSIGFLIVLNSLHSKSLFSRWWILTTMGVACMIVGIASIINFSSAAETISNLIGISVLLSGVSLTILAFWKKNFKIQSKN